MRRRGPLRLARRAGARLDLIAAAAGAVVASGARRVGVVATTATASSGAYGDAIRARVPGAEVREVAAPALVPLVEAGVRGRAAQEAVAAACAGLTGNVDAVVLACSHYPLLDAEFAGVFGERVVRIDPAIAQAERVAAWASERAPAAAPQPDRYFTNGALDAFRRRVAAVMGPQAAVAAASSDDVEDVEEQHDGHRAERTAGDDLKHGCARKYTRDQPTIGMSTRNGSGCCRRGTSARRAAR